MHSTLLRRAPVSNEIRKKSRVISFDSSASDLKNAGNSSACKKRARGGSGNFFIPSAGLVPLNNLQSVAYPNKLEARRPLHAVTPENRGGAAMSALVKRGEADERNAVS